MMKTLPTLLYDTFRYQEDENTVVIYGRELDDLVWRKYVIKGVSTPWVSTQTRLTDGLWDRFKKLPAHYSHIDRMSYMGAHGFKENQAELPHNYH